MGFKTKLLIVAMASAMPLVSVHAQTQAELQKEIAALRAQLQSLQQKVEAMGAKAETAAPSAAVAQQVNRLEQRLDLADDEAEQSGWKGLKFKGVAEATFAHDNESNNNAFDARDGQPVGAAMLEFTKEVEGSEGVGFTLRLTPNNAGSALVHEASIQVPVSEGHRIVGGLVPDYQGYEMGFANLNPLVTHNALFDMAGPTSYTGIGMSNQLTDDVALKWIVGNIDGATDEQYTTDNAYTRTFTNRSVGAAFRFDWTLSEFSYLGFSGAMANVNRNFQVYALDGGHTRGDWTFNGHLNFGSMQNAAYNGDNAEWVGLSGLVGYKVTPRLQLVARADYIHNRKNGGGVYAYNHFNNAQDAGDLRPMSGTGLGPELDGAGNQVLDADGNAVGANLARLSLGTNYMLNPSTQWKLEYRIDQSSGHNFTIDNVASRTKTTVGTSFVVSF